MPKPRYTTSLIYYLKGVALAFTASRALAGDLPSSVTNLMDTMGDLHEARSPHVTKTSIPFGDIAYFFLGYEDGLKAQAIWQDRIPLGPSMNDGMEIEMEARQGDRSLRTVYDAANSAGSVDTVVTSFRKKIGSKVAEAVSERRANAADQAAYERLCGSLAVYAGNKLPGRGEVIRSFHKLK